MSASLLDAPDQYDAYMDVQARLTREFSGVPAPVVEEVVQRWLHSFDGARVTLYLPILVERASRDELAHLAAFGRAGSPASTLFAGEAPSPAPTPA